MLVNDAFLMLRDAAGPLEAKVVLKHLLGVDSVGLIDAAKKELTWWQAFKVRRRVRQLKRGMPVAKIVGGREFYGLWFETARGTLDPRPDSETIIEAVKQFYPDTNLKLRFLDCGTGTGCLIGALAHVYPNSTGVGIDISFAAIRIAMRNIMNLGLYNRVHISRRDFKIQLLEKFDVIVSNPPYIPEGDDRVDRSAQFDPHMALYAGVDGLDAYRALANSASKMLNENGHIFLEIGQGQADDVRRIFNNHGWKFIDGRDDLAGIQRVLIFSK